MDRYRKEYETGRQGQGSAGLSGFQITQFLEQNKYKKAGNGDPGRCKNCVHSQITGITKAYKKYTCVLLGMRCKSGYRCKNFLRGEKNERTKN